MPGTAVPNPETGSGARMQSSTGTIAGPEAAAIVDPAIAMRRHFAPKGVRLRLGILLPSGDGVAHWAAEMLQMIYEESAIEVVCSRIEPQAKARPSWLLELARRALDPTGGPFARVALPSFLQDVPGPVERHEHPSTPEDEAPAEPDLWLWLGEDPPTFAHAPASRLGIWYFHFGHPERPLWRPAYLRELIAGEKISVLALQRWSPDGTRETVAEVPGTTLIEWDFTRNAKGLIGMGTHLLHSTLLDLVINESVVLRSARPSSPPASVRAPSPIEISRFIGQRTAHSIHVRLRPRLPLGKHTWAVALRERTGEGSMEELSGFVQVPMPAGIMYADPFIIEKSGRHWLFVEHMRHDRPNAWISCMEVFDDLSVGAPITALKEPYHLSYPLILQEEGEYYMIPESGEDHSVQLYRATDFPFSWEWERTLFKGFGLLDTTPVFWEGMWYFFATLGSRPVTFLFTAESLTGPWSFHPENPICSDARRSRGAGAIFSYQGSLVRPAQDCSIRYGQRIVLNRIVRLTPSEYREEPFDVIEPDQDRGMVALHTLNRNSRYEVIDYVIPLDRD